MGAVALALVLPAGAGAAEAKFDAHGSAKQVYVTGLDPGARMTLVRGHETVATKRAAPSSIRQAGAPRAPAPATRPSRKPPAGPARP